MSRPIFMAHWAIDLDAPFDPRTQPKEFTAWWLPRRPSLSDIKFFEGTWYETDSQQRHRLILKRDGLDKWYGPWAPHPPWAFSQEDSVQSLRWETIFNWNPASFGSEAEMNKMKRHMAAKEAIATEWLLRRKQVLLDMPSVKGGNTRKCWI